MKQAFDKIKSFLLIISGVALVLYIIRIMKDVPLPDDIFPLAEEKKAAEKEVEQIKDDIKELEKKEYSDKEIEDKFNK